MEDSLRFPIGKFTPQETYTQTDITGFINRIESLPQRMEATVKGLSDSQLDTPYRDGGWTLRQVVHHVADSHMNAYIRFKWMLTEDTPIIKAYDEKRWAETPETKEAVSLSLSLIHALHKKWVALLRQIPPADWSRQFIHPETKKFVRACDMFGLYAWHGDHHLAHITSLKDQKGWK